MALCLSVFDQIRAVLGALLANLIFVWTIYPRKKRFVWKSVLILLVCGIFSVLRVYLQMGYANEVPRTMIIVYSIICGLVITAASVIYIRWCFELSWGYAMFLGVFGFCLEKIATLLLRYWIVGILAPEFPEHHFLWYVLFSCMLYSLLYGLCRKFFVPRLRQRAEELDGHRGYHALYLLIYLFFSMASYSAFYVYEWVLTPFLYKKYTAYVTEIRYFCMGIMLLICIMLFTMQYIAYLTATFRQEKLLLQQMIAEKGRQYEMSKANIEMINRKCHDLKHQLSAMRYTDFDERNALLEETRDAVMFYEAVIHTGNEALDTLLTEKNFYCVQNNIRLSCMVCSSNLDKIGVVDMYTMLGNAIDNAIESVEKLSDEGKRAISLSVTEKGNIQYITMDNYYSGELMMSGDLPVTSKQDADSHGFGLKSIRLIAKKYGGDIRIYTEDSIFSLQIAIPV